MSSPFFGVWTLAVAVTRSTGGQFDAMPWAIGLERRLFSRRGRSVACCDSDPRSQGPAVRLTKQRIGLGPVSL